MTIGPSKQRTETIAFRVPTAWFNTACKLAEGLDKPALSVAHRQIYHLGLKALAENMQLENRGAIDEKTS